MFRLEKQRKGVPALAKMRRALLAGLLGLALAALCSNAALAVTWQIGPEATIDSATDDGGGKIRISWSLEATPQAGYAFSNTTPSKVCVTWEKMENGEPVESTDTCFTSEVSNQDDLLIDTGIGGDGPTTEYRLMLVPYYGSIPLRSQNEDGSWTRTNVTLNAT